MAIEKRRDAQRAREALEESADVARLQGDLEALRAELAGAVHEYRVVTTAARLVRTTLRSYVRDRQPGVLERASAAFADATAGRFERSSRRPRRRPTRSSSSSGTARA